MCDKFERYFWQFQVTIYWPHHFRKMWENITVRTKHCRFHELFHISLTCRNVKNYWLLDTQNLTFKIVLCSFRFSKRFLKKAVYMYRLLRDDIFKLSATTFLITPVKQKIILLKLNFNVLWKWEIWTSCKKLKTRREQGV